MADSNLTTIKNYSNTEVPAEVLVLLSGGLDSASCLDFYINLDRPTHAMFIDYQQASVYQEKKSAIDIADYYSTSLSITNWVGIKDKHTGLIQGRNAFLLTAALMEMPDCITTIAIGIHSGTKYSDCSHNFIEKMQAVFDMYTNGLIKIAAPFKDWSKADIWAYANKGKMPVELTYSCESGEEKPCGICESCLDRVGIKSNA